MEQTIDSQEILDQIMFPVFLVKDGIIVKSNHAALQRQIEIGAAIQDMLCTGQQEYAEFANGRLCLALRIDNIICNASVIRKETYDLFYLESEYSDAEMRALALASQYLREPLANAMTCTSNMDRELIAQAPPDLRQQFLEIQRNLHQIHRAICNMSDATSYFNKRYARAENQNVSAVVREIMEKVQTLTANTDKQLEYSGLNKPLYCLVETEKLERAILNLLSNAFKYASDGSTIRAKLECKKDKLSFSVQNDISGMPIPTQESLFTHFLREPGIENIHSGIGLGMTIVRNAAIAHRGTLLFDQPASDAVRFTMTIAMQKRTSDNVFHSPISLSVDYAGGYDHALTELSDILPVDRFE